MKKNGFFSTSPLGMVLYFGSVLNRPEEFKVTHKGVFSSVRITCHLSDKDCKKESSISSINTWAVLILCLCLGRKIVDSTVPRERCLMCRRERSKLSLLWSDCWIYMDNNCYCMRYREGYMRNVSMYTFREGAILLKLCTEIEQSRFLHSNAWFIILRTVSNYDKNIPYYNVFGKFL